MSLTNLQQLSCARQAAAGSADLRAEAQEGLAVFAPLANRLGVWSLKAELEDLCFLVRAMTNTYLHVFRLPETNLPFLSGGCQCSSCCIICTFICT